MSVDSFAVLVRPDGSFRLIDWPTDPAKTSTVIRAVVDCRFFDVVQVTRDLSMWLDDEGILTAPINFAATWLYALHQPPHQHYHGRALFTGGADAQGDTLGLTADQAAHLIEQLTTRRLPRQTRTSS
ncbi:DUF3846 domain-containing protein [Streptomyces sp. NPDC017941]|uniref:DUF3846 domain-containing protein n=1 Tax=unclassified Streptomyces TaxID=2593676 RepID=UPI0037A7FC15